METEVETEPEAEMKIEVAVMSSEGSGMAESWAGKSIVWIIFLLDSRWRVNSIGCASRSSVLVFRLGLEAVVGCECPRNAYDDCSLLRSLYLKIRRMFDGGS
jgi:hypothetical protein